MARKAFNWTGLSPFKCRLVVNVKPVDANALMLNIVHPNSGEIIVSRKLPKGEMSKEALSESQYFEKAIEIGNQMISNITSYIDNPGQIETLEQKPANVYGKKRAKKNENS